MSEIGLAVARFPTGKQTKARTRKHNALGASKSLWEHIQRVGDVLGRPDQGIALGAPLDG